MTKGKRIFRIIGYTLLAVFIIIQFIRPERNDKTDGNADLASIASNLQMPDDVKNIMKTACTDCHSNHTEYPWYNNIQPVAWWLNDHVTEGKKALNFSIFTEYRPYRQFHKFEQVVKLVKKDAMPLSSYLIIHRDAKLNQEQKNAITSWAEARMNSMREEYPADSLVNPNAKTAR
jgi:hypothetical protein